MPTTSYTYNITGHWSGTWGAEADENWLHTSLDTENTILHVTAEDNPNYNTSRSGNVYVTYDGEECKQIPVVQSGKTCDCGAFDITQTRGSIPQSGLSSGATLMTYNSSGGCSGLTATIQKESSLSATALTVKDGYISLANSIPANSTQSAITYNIEIEHSDTSSACTSYYLQQEGTVITCDCGTSSMVVDAHTIPYDGCVGSQLLVFEAYLWKDNGHGTPVEAFSRECYNSLTWTGRTGSGAFTGNYTISADTLTNVTTPQGSGSVTDLRVYVNNVSPNSSKTRKWEVIDIGFADGNKWCVNITVKQDGFVPCTCDDLVGSFWQNPDARYFTPSGSGEVLFASGQTYGCGSMAGYPSNVTGMCDDETFFKTFEQREYEDPEDSGNTIYQWWGSVCQTNTEKTRLVGTINFKYKDSFGEEINCPKNMSLSILRNGCPCQDLPTEGITKTISVSRDGESGVQLLAMNGVTLTRNSSYGYCSYVAIIPRESENPWFTRAQEVYYNNNTHTISSYISNISANYTCERRTCIFDVYSIINYANSIGSSTSVQYTYNPESDLLCEKLGEVTLIQDPKVCTCEDMLYTYPEGKINVPFGETYYNIIGSLCGTLVGDPKCVTDDGSEEEVDFVTASYFNGLLRVQRSETASSSTEDRNFYVKVVFKSNCDETLVCPYWFEGALLGCNCTNASVNYKFDSGQQRYYSMNGNVIVITLGTTLIGCDNVEGWIHECDAMLPNNHECDNVAYPDKWIKGIDASFESDRIVVSITACTNNTGASRQTEIKFKPKLRINGETVFCNDVSDTIYLTQTYTDPCASCRDKVGSQSSSVPVFSYNEYMNDGLTQPAEVFRLSVGNTENCETGIHYIFAYRDNSSYQSQDISIPGYAGNFYIESATTDGGKTLLITAIPTSENQTSDVKYIELFARPYNSSETYLSNCVVNTSVHQYTNSDICNGGCDTYEANTLRTYLNGFEGLDISNPIVITAGTDCSTFGGAAYLGNIPPDEFGNCYEVRFTSTNNVLCNGVLKPVFEFTHDENGNYYAACCKFGEGAENYLNITVDLYYKDANNQWHPCSPNWQINFRVLRG